MEIKNYQKLSIDIKNNIVDKLIETVNETDWKMDDYEYVCQKNNYKLRLLSDRNNEKTLIVTKDNALCGECFSSNEIKNLNKLIELVSSKISGKQEYSFWNEFYNIL